MIPASSQSARIGPNSSLVSVNPAPQRDGRHLGSSAGQSPQRHLSDKEQMRDVPPGGD